LISRRAAQELRRTDWASRLWGIPDRPPVCPGAFVIPSYAVVDSLRPTRPTCAQIELAAEWWQRCPESVLIMSTGDNQRLGVSNARVMAGYARGIGVPASSIIEEDRSHNTMENLHYSLEIVQGRGFREATLVTVDLYTRRAVATARKLGWPELRWLSAYSRGESGYGHKWLQTRSRGTMLVYEMVAMAVSRLLGWV
jgi:uncharacterized SAM-binding protein YcdF (DUF218 family)